MKLKLYLDCDGVILNTASDDIYEKLMKMGIDNQEKIQEYFANLDWVTFIKLRGEIDDASSKIKELSEIFDIEILTHVNSKSEEEAKVKYFGDKLPGVKVIGVPKSVEKADYINPNGAILVDDYLPNLDYWHGKGGTSVKFSDSGKRYDYITITDLDELSKIDFKSKIKMR